MKLIQHQELSSSQASITFSSIPQTYTDLLLVVSARSTTGNDAFVTFNGSTANFTSRHLEGTGSSAGSFSRTDNFAGWFNASGATANTFGSWAMYVPNYTSANNKSFSIDSVTENNATTTRQFITAGLWSNTSAITSIAVSTSGNMAQYSSATLYGVLKGSDGVTTVS